MDYCQGLATARWLSVYRFMLIKPKLQDLVAARELLRLFGTTSGLQMEYRETSATVIRGGPQEEELVFFF
jgi:hypothetical protein